VIALRLAEPADCERVYEWNFAPDVRAQSKNPQPVSLAEHARWYANRIQRDIMWIVELDGEPVGVVRLDPEPAGARISIALAPTSRGHGIGRRAISLAKSLWAGPIVAEVSLTNTASRLCFEACGFIAAPSHDNLVTYHWSP
jgi:UDP-2,4-diacetamido-2,4,6-trideoxy-beta-L-altropyranose hydrolase